MMKGGSFSTNDYENVRWLCTRGVPTENKRGG